MHPRALIAIGGELLREFRQHGGPADRITEYFFHHRRYLGAHDRRFIADAFFHTLRHLRRIDEALGAAFTGLWVSRPAIGAGYPVTDRLAAAQWQTSNEYSGPIALQLLANRTFASKNKPPIDAASAEEPEPGAPQPGAPHSGAPQPGAPEAPAESASAANPAPSTQSISSIKSISSTPSAISAPVAPSPRAALGEDTSPEPPPGSVFAYEAQKLGRIIKASAQRPTRRGEAPNTPGPRNISGPSAQSGPSGESRAGDSGAPLRPKPSRRTQWIDTARIALAAADRGLEDIAFLAPELHETWPEYGDAGAPLAPTPERLIRLFTQAMDSMKTFGNDSHPRNADRTYSFPAWLWGGLGYDLAPKEWMQLGAALNQTSPTTLRVNTLRCGVAEAQSALKTASLAFHPGEWAPEAIHLEERAGADQLPGRKDGWFEFQDEASQLCSMFANPKPGQTVVDACAGGGGKALHLAALMKNQGRILCFDSAESRLRQLEQRRQRADAKIIQLLKLEEGGQPPANLKDAADIVLIDAPCSGTGTLRRRPDLRWRLTPERVAELAAVQARLLEKWSRAVKPGGILIYATCSLLNEENGARVEAFLEKHSDFERDAEGGRQALESRLAPPPKLAPSMDELENQDREKDIQDAAPAAGNIAPAAGGAASTAGSAAPSAGSRSLISSGPAQKSETIAQRAAALLNRRGELVILPHRHGCDGFFATRLRRKAKRS